MDITQWTHVEGQKRDATSMRLGFSGTRMNSGGTYLAKQRNQTPPAQAPAHLREKASGTPRLLPNIHRFRVMNGEKIIGQFSNMKLVEEALIGKRQAVVFDVSMCPSRLIYKDGKWLLGMIQ